MTAPSIKVRVTAAPESGRANEAVLGVLAEALGVTKGTLRLVAGAGSRRKVVEVPLAEAEALARLRESGRP